MCMWKIKCFIIRLSVLNRRVKSRRYSRSAEGPMDVLGENEALQQFFDGKTFIMSCCHLLLNAMHDVPLCRKESDVYDLITMIRSFFNINN